MAQPMALGAQPQPNALGSQSGKKVDASSAPAKSKDGTAEEGATSFADLLVNAQPIVDPASATPPISGNAPQTVSLQSQPPQGSAVSPGAIIAAQVQTPPDVNAQTAAPASLSGLIAGAKQEKGTPSATPVGAEQRALVLQPTAAQTALPSDGASSGALPSAGQSPANAAAAAQNTVTGTAPAEMAASAADKPKVVIDVKGAPHITPEESLPATTVSGKPTATTAAQSLVGEAAPAAQVAKEVSHMLRHGTERLNFTLHPEELGRVRITMKTSETFTEIRIVVERPQALESLRHNLGALAQTLETQSADGNNRDLRLSLSADDGNGRQADREQADQHRDRRHGQDEAMPDFERHTQHADNPLDDDLVL